MDYELLLGDPAHSSWSMRLGLLVDRFDLNVKQRFTTLYCDQFAQDLADFAPTRTVPALRLPSGTVVTESLAIAEELASRFPDAGLWPSDSDARAVARALAAEMHAGFLDLREECPMNLRAAYIAAPVSDRVAQDLARLDNIWCRALDQFDGPWLCGTYSIADVFFAPVAARIAGYGLSVGARSRGYVGAHLADPAFVDWRAMGLRDGPHQAVYDRDYPQRDWPEASEYLQA